MYKYFYFFLLSVIIFSCKKDTQKTVNEVFKLLKPEDTGVDFTNSVTETEGFNILSYRNFYNGGGVAVGDINNDDSPDIFFTSNQGKNKLFLNKSPLTPGGGIWLVVFKDFN